MPESASRSCTPVTIERVTSDSLPAARALARMAATALLASLSFCSPIVRRLVQRGFAATMVSMPRNIGRGSPASNPSLAPASGRNPSVS